MRVEWMIQCHNFQHRLCWMLSSLLQQDKPGDVDLIVNVACLKGNGDPTTEEVAGLFLAKGLDVKLTVYDDIEVFQRRGWTRNKQLAESDADYAVFADSDMVYPREFIRKMVRALRSRERSRGVTPLKVLHGPRKSTERALTDDLVAELDYPVVVEGAFEKAEKLPSKRKIDVGAGYFQVIDIRKLRKYNGGLYQPEGVAMDRSWAKGQRARSDLYLKRLVGREKLKGIPCQIHLQHARDNEAGHHLEVQR